MFKSLTPENLFGKKKKKQLSIYTRNVHVLQHTF